MSEFELRDSVAIEPVSPASFGMCCALSADASMLVVAEKDSLHTYDWVGNAWAKRGQALLMPDIYGSPPNIKSCALSADGLILAVGADFLNININKSTGGVYIHVWNGSAWVLREVVSVPGVPGQNGMFGLSCTLSANGLTLAAGSDYGHKSVYIYDFDGTSWIVRMEILAPDQFNYYLFGQSCALSADASVLVVGSDHYYEDTYVTLGEIFTYDLNGSIAVLREGIYPSAPFDTDLFGVSCALSADASILVSGDHERLHIYALVAGAWVHQGVLQPPAEWGQFKFARDCSLSADASVLAVGAQLYAQFNVLDPWGGGEGNGSVLIYQLPTTTPPPDPDPPPDVSPELGLHLLPPNALKQERDLSLSVERAGHVPIEIRSTVNADTCPSHLLSWLAWSLSVDIWDDQWSEAEKRAVIRSAIDVHQHKGTPGAIINALTAMGYPAVSVYDLSGEPFQFSVALGIRERVSDNRFTLIRERIAMFKNARSQLIKLNLFSLYHDDTATRDGTFFYSGDING